MTPGQGKARIQKIGALTGSAVPVAMAVLHLQPTTMGVLEQETGLPKSTIVGALNRLRLAGLVQWTPECRGTITARFRCIPIDTISLGETRHE